MNRRAGRWVAGIMATALAACGGGGGGSDSAATSPVAGSVARTDYNYFVHPAEIAAGPLQVRVTALGGATLLDTLPEPAGGVVVQGKAQFP